MLSVYQVSLRRTIPVWCVAREIEQAVAAALQSGALAGNETLPITMTLELAALKLSTKFEGEIKLI